MTETPQEARLDALLEAHAAIAEDIGAEQVMNQDDAHQTGEREALLRVEELIHETVDKTPDFSEWEDPETLLAEKAKRELSKRNHTPR